MNSGSNSKDGLTRDAFSTPTHRDTCTRPPPMSAGAYTLLPVCCCVADFCSVLLFTDSLSAMSTQLLNFVTFKLHE